MAEFPSGGVLTALDLLQRIEAKIDAIVAVVLGQKANSAPVKPLTGDGSDADLDGKYGDEEVRKVPPRYHGDDFAGKKMSECSVEQLESLAGFKDWQASKDAATDSKKAGYERRTAARARGWIRRKMTLGEAHAAFPQSPEPSQLPLSEESDGTETIPF